MIHEAELGAMSIPYSKLKLGAKIGEGGFGVVYQATYIFDNVAVKVLKNQELLTDEVKKEFIAESKVMNTLRSEFIVQLRGVCLEQNHLSLVMEYLPTSLYKLLKSDTPLDWQMLQSASLDIAKGIGFLHDKSIIHRDLKSLNILLDKNNRAKLCDFGLVKLKNHSGSTSSHFKGTLAWAAPELFDEPPVYSYASDIYAYGVILWEMAARKIPFQGVSAMQIMKKLSKGDREPIPSDTPSDFKQLIESCWAQKAEQRPHLLEIIQTLEQFNSFKKEVDLAPIQPTGPSQKNTQSGPIYFIPSTTTSTKLNPNLEPIQPNVLSQKDNQSAPIYFTPSTTIITKPSNEASAKTLDPMLSGPQYQFATVSTQSGPQSVQSTSSETSTVDIPGETDFQIGYQHFLKCQYTQSLPYFLKAVAALYPPACLYLYLLHDVGGRIGPKNPTESTKWKIEAAKYFKWFEAQAGTDQAQAQYHLAWCYDKGLGVSQNEQKAFEYYEKAAKQGCIEAQNNLGLCYHKKGVPQAYKQAFSWYQKAADQGNTDAQNNLGLCYQNGQGVTQDDKQAIDWYQKAAEQGYANAQFNLGWCKEVQQDYKQAVYWYQKAAEQGHTNAQYNLGFCYKNGQGVTQDYKQAVYWYQKAAEQGYANAQFNLGVCYKNGQGVIQDDKQAIDWYQKAAEQGNKAAQNNLGVCYQNGQGVTQDYKQAILWYQKAAEQGLASAQNNLGFCYKNGRGVPQDDKQAVYWYQKAAEQGLASAQNNLGVCYYDGQGIQQDYKQATLWYQKAAEQGLASAQNNLGFCYKNGRGVPQDDKQAVYWYQKAAEQGDADAQTNLDNLLKAQPSLKNSLSANANPSFFKSESPKSNEKAPNNTKKFGN